MPLVRKLKGQIFKLWQLIYATNTLKPGFHYPSWRVTGFHYPSTRADVIRRIWYIVFEMSCVGAIFLNDCPAQKFIPLFLLVGGCLKLIMNIIELVNAIRNMRDPDAPPSAFSKFRKVFQIILALCVMVWFIVGESFSVVFFSVYLSVSFCLCVWSFSSRATMRKT